MYEMYEMDVESLKARYRMGTCSQLYITKEQSNELETSSFESRA